jgi:carbon-monoxide dehydrogenase large subunit
LTLAATKEGKVTALHVDLLANMGAYMGLVGPAIPILGAYMYNAIYKFAAYRFEVKNILTNMVRTDAYRGAAGPRRRIAIERLMDDLAVELDMDPLELRAKNWITAEEFPFTTVRGFEYDSGNYEAATAKPKSCSTTTGCGLNRPNAVPAKIPCSSESASRHTPSNVG